MISYHIGIDSTDSADLGMCTTYLGAVLLERISTLDVKLISYPELVRLNPNVPWKTRGNGAIYLGYEGPGDVEKALIGEVEKVIEELSVFDDPQTNPGMVVLKGEIGDDLRSFYHRTLHRIIDVDDALNVAEANGAYSRGWKNKMGVIGALAAVGADLKAHTFEAILYRPGAVKERKRSVDAMSLRDASLNHPGTFFNVDKDGDPVCIPHSPCPVILGIRGIDPRDTLEALGQVKVVGFERWVLWKTNQHTDAHIESIDDLSFAEPLSSITTEVTISGTPEYISGGHLITGCRDKEGNTADIAAYEPTKGFRKLLSRLLAGDRGRIWGSVRTDNVPHRTINLEKIEVLELGRNTVMEHPRCPKCSGATESMGKGQGLRCKKCRYRGSDLVPVERELARDIEPGLIEPPPDAWRHLFKPSSIPIIEEKEYNGPFWGLEKP
ncbi:MAG: tRNA(Ile)(2)-agmatinylcytidine synthase [Candidatus Thermoplasmatota archaeon]|nr:tRNA(Ile)(2)-agmatinylcytidine synthase [Candidatus Thermoplasmatota archaeon]